MKRRVHFPRVLCTLLLAGLVAAGWPTGAPPARAQAEAGQAIITAVDAASFPIINTFMQVSDASGARLPGLLPSAFQLIEDGAPVSGLSVTEEDVGVQVVFVLDANNAFSVRDINGVTRMEYIQQALAGYALNEGGMKPGIDDVTVLAGEGVVIEHSNNPALLAQAVNQYASAFAGVADQFPLLNRGIDYAADAPRQPGVRRMVVFISNGIVRSDADSLLAEVSSRANAAQIPIYTMYVGPAGSEAIVSATHLLRLAQETGGQRLVYEGPQSFAPLFQLLADEGRQYRLSYRSRLASTGQHTLAAAVTLADGEAVQSNQVVVPLRIEAPRVALAPLPETLVRIAPAHDSPPAEAEPTVYDVAMVVDFPDGHPRGIQQAELLVDGQVVATLPPQQEPLTAIAWPLAQQGLGGDHVVQVRVMDELGLVAESAEATVSISLQVPAAPEPAVGGPLSLPSWPLLTLAGLGVGLALAVGVGAWWVVTRRAEQPPQQPQRAAPTRRAWPAARAADSESAMPAVPNGNGQPSAPGPQRRGVSLPSFRWPQRGQRQAARGLASLEVIEPGGGGAARADIELRASAVTLGRDAALAEMVFHDRSVSRLHARIAADDGVFRIYDAGSTSGTWVNYAPIEAEKGCRLRDGDLINLGRVQLRFKINQAAAPPDTASVRIVRAGPPKPPNEEAT